MPNTLLIGKDLPDSLDFAEILAKTGRKVFVTNKSELDSAKYDSEDVFSGSWNRNSAISARSLIIKAETKLQKIDEVIIYFDSLYYASKFDSDKTENVSAAIEQMITGYQFFINELLMRIGQRQDSIAISFLLRSSPSRFDMMNSSTFKNLNLFPCSNIIAACEKAFETFAENTAVQLHAEENITVFLAQCNAVNELYKNEQEIIRWLVSSVESIVNGKSKQKIVTWNKAGTKLSTGFSFFRKNS